MLTFDANGEPAPSFRHSPPDPWVRAQPDVEAWELRAWATEERLFDAHLRSEMMQIGAEAAVARAEAALSDCGCDRGSAAPKPRSSD